MVLHALGLAHGNVKPSNMLLFALAVTKEGVLVNSYAARLSDFGSAVFDTGFNQRFPRGTRDYTAPEVDVAVETGLDIAELELSCKRTFAHSGHSLLLSAAVSIGSLPNLPA